MFTTPPNKAISAGNNNNDDVSINGTAVEMSSDVGVSEWISWRYSPNGRVSFLRVDWAN